MLDALSDFFFGDQRRKYIAISIGFLFAELIVVAGLRVAPSPVMALLLILAALLCTFVAARAYSLLTRSSARREGMWRAVAYLGVLFGAVACAANVRTVQFLRNAEALVEKSHGLILGIELERPRQGDVQLDYRTEIMGRIELRTDSDTDLTRHNEVGLELDRRGLELVAVVHPLATDDWWVQPPVKIEDDGSFRSLIYIGEQEFGKGEEFEIAAILVPRGDFKEGLRLRDIPITYGSSSIIKVRRQI